MRLIKTTTLLLALSVAGVTSAQQPSGLTEAQVRQLLAEQGYTKIDDLDFKSGVWKGEATSANGKRTDVKVDPANGQVFTDAPVSNLSENDIKAKLTAAGYTKVHSVEFDDGLWKAKAERADGQDFKVQLSPKDGSVVSAEND